VDDDTIAAVEPVSRLPSHDQAEIVDFSHCTILPALVDCSVSLGQSPSVDDRVRSAAATAGGEQAAAMMARHVRDCHDHGVLGVAETGDISDVRRQLPPLSIREGGVVIREAARVHAGGSPQVHATDGDFLRISYSGSIEAGTGVNPESLDFGSLGRILQQRGPRKAVVVANGRRMVEEALAAGCDAIEQGYGMGEENLRKMADLGVLWIPSVLRARSALDGSGSGGDVCCRFSQRYVAPGKPVPGAEAFWKSVLAEQIQQLRLARELGVQVAVGTGAGSLGILAGEAVVEEMKLFIKAGFTLAEAIRCASKTGAAFFGMNGLGELAIGRRATFLITRGTPQQLPRKLAFLEGMFIDGAPGLAGRGGRQASAAGRPES
jgi:imidazolonepropionase-like amidohydrolase